MKNLLVIAMGCCLALPFPSRAQLTLSACQEMARQNYPMIKQLDLIEKTKTYNVSNANKAYLPRVTLNAKVSYQSDVTTVPSFLLKDMPAGVSYDGMSKTQYQAYLQVDQIVFDGNAVASQKKMLKASAEADKEQVEVQLYALRERVNNVYFGLLLVQEQLKLNDLFYQELLRAQADRQAMMASGVAQQADLDAVKVQLIENRQQQVTLQSNRSAYLRVMSALTGKDLAEEMLLELPAELAAPDITIKTQLSKLSARPEHTLFESKIRQLEVQKSGVQSKNLPRLSAFLQGGMANPALNMFAPGLTPYYIGGLTFSWTFGNLYTRTKELKNIELAKQQVGLQEETFYWTLKQQLLQQHEDFRKNRELMSQDEELIKLRDRLRLAAETKMKNGTLSTTEYLREVAAWEAARIQMLNHKLQSLMLAYGIKVSLNN